MSTDVPPIVSIIGRKNSGKTTFVVALARELRRRGLRLASVKHGHHDFEIDHPGRDSWRHFHEGGVEAVVLASDRQTALVMREPDEPDPRDLIRRLLGGRGYDLVLVEGYKHGPFPKIELVRSATGKPPLFDADHPMETDRIALVTDRADLDGEGAPVIPLDPGGAHVVAVADLLERRFELARQTGA